MVTPNLRNLNTRQLLQLQEQRRISSQEAANELMRRRQIEEARRNRQAIERERLEEAREQQQALSRTLSTPQARQLAEESFQRQRAAGTLTRAPEPKPLTRAQELAQERLQQAREMQAAEARTLSTPEAREAAVRSFERIAPIVAPQARAIKVLEPFRTPAGYNVTAAVRQVSDRTLVDAGFTKDQIRQAKTRAAASNRLAPFTDQSGDINLDAARRAGVDRATLKTAGFTKDQIAESQMRVASLRRLRPYAVTGGGYDIVRAVNDQVSPVTLRGAGFTQQQINEAQELNRNLNPAPGTRKWYLDVGKSAGVTAADAVVPGLWVRNWNNLSNTERATNIALDALFLVPLVGVAAKGAKAAKVAGSAAAAARSTKRTSKAAKELRTFRAASRADKAQELTNRIDRIDQTFSGAQRKARLDTLLESHVQSSSKPLPKARIRKETEALRDRIDKIDESFKGAERKQKLEQLLLDSQVTRGVDRIQDVALLRTADEVAKIVLRKTGNAALADEARKASVRAGEAMATGDAQALKTASRTLAEVGRRGDLKALTSRGKALESKSVSVADFFKQARTGDGPKAPKTVEDRIRNIDEFFKGAEKIDTQAAQARLQASEERLLKQEIRIAERKLKDLETRGTGTPRTKQLLQERIQRTKVQLAERPRVSPKLETLLTTAPGGPLAKVSARTVPQAARKVVTKQLAKTSTRTAARQSVALLAAPAVTTPSKVKSIAVPRIQPATKSITTVQAQVLPKSVVKTDQVTKVATKPAVASQVKVKPVPKTQPKTAVKVAVKTAPQTKTQVQTKVVPKVQTKTQTRVQTKRQPKVARAVITKAPTQVLTGRRFRVPNPEEQKKLKFGEFPRVISFQQGVVDVTVDIDRGTRSFSKARTTGKNVTPQSTFKIVTKDQSRPTAKVFRQGIVDVVVTPRSLFFSGRRGNLLRSRRS